LQQINRFIVSQNSVPGIGACRSQSKRSITMERRQETIEQGGWNTVAPSAVAYHENEEAPLALDKRHSKVITDLSRLLKERSKQVFRLWKFMRRTGI
jgi:hypothetical protein